MNYWNYKKKLLSRNAKELIDGITSTLKREEPARSTSSLKKLAKQALREQAAEVTK